MTQLEKLIIFGGSIIIGLMLSAVGGIAWAIWSSGTATPRVLVGVACSLFLGWIVARIQTN